MTRRDTTIIAYVATVVVAAVVAVAACTAHYGISSAVAPEGLRALGAFTVLAIITGVIEHTSDAGLGGSVAFVALLAAVVVVGPIGATAVAVFATTISQIWLRRAPIKTTFNVAQIGLSTLAGGVAYSVAGGQIGPHAFTNQDVASYIALVVTYFTVNSTAVSGVVAISQGRSYGDVWRVQVMKAAGYDLVASALGLLVAWMYLRFDLYGIFGVILPIMAIRQAYRENVELKRANSELQQKHRELLDLFVKEIELGDPYTSGHSQRVSKFAAVIAREVGLAPHEVQAVSTAALLHDVGKGHHEFGVILRKEGKLSPDEKRLLQTHPVRSAELVSTISAFRGEVERAVRHHHENYDGTGYPDGLAGDDIPIAARIIMIADTVDAMTTDRPYRKALPFDMVVEQLRRYGGRQFDPKLTEIAIRSTTIRSLIGDSGTVNLELASLWPSSERKGLVGKAVVS